jgi:hypothetical protein
MLISVPHSCTIVNFKRKTASKLKVVVGQVSVINADPNEQTLAVYTITLAPQYNSTLQTNDIALLKVYNKMKNSEKCCVGDSRSKIVSFPQLTADIEFDYVNVDFAAYNELDDGKPTVVMGWGATFVS